LEVKVTQKEKAEPIIRIENLHKNFDQLEVLKGISLTIHKGEVVTLIGASGSGKVHCCDV
jgi:ABC-type histidine transport system ATPase subunit